jgi:hypothetical protein
MQKPFDPHIPEQQSGSEPPDGEQEVLVPLQHIPEPPQLPVQQSGALVQADPRLVQQTFGELGSPRTWVHEPVPLRNAQHCPLPEHGCVRARQEDELSSEPLSTVTTIPLSWPVPVPDPVPVPETHASSAAWLQLAASRH